MRIKDLADQAVKETIKEFYPHIGDTGGAYPGMSAPNKRNPGIPEAQKQRAIEAASLAFANIIGIAGEGKGYQDLVRKIQNALDGIDIFASIDYDHPNGDWVDKDDFVEPTPYGIGSEINTMYGESKDK
tara:strand:- start:22957 stop:23343 length:387 start_codon:yes stop_codon:yes gene_type:complete